MLSDHQPFLFLFLGRDLDARAKNERYRSAFRLTQEERLDGHTDCTLWTPFAKMHVVGQLFISTNYICFSSKEEDLCQLIIPLREVRSQVDTSSVSAGPGHYFYSSCLAWPDFRCGEGRQQ